LAPLVLNDGAVEGIKWLALGLMTLDHLNKYLLGDHVPALFALGRLAMPLFATVLAYNLARPDARERGVYPRVVRRLAATAVLAQIPFVALGALAWGWYPLNVLAMLLVATLIIWLLDAGGRFRILLGVGVFLIGGALVEFWWAGVAVCVAAWAYGRRPGARNLAIWIGSCAALYIVNGNFWALGAFPVILCAAHIRWQIPRFQWAFYVYYPTHLAALWGISRLVLEP
jgi:hypothetical protein